MRLIRRAVALASTILASSLLASSVTATLSPRFDLVEREENIALAPTNASPTTTTNSTTTTDSSSAAATDSSAATWIYAPDGADGGNFTFTITVNAGNGDMWFRMSAPNQYSWIAVGAGTNMASSKAMFIAYEGHKENSITISARGPCDKCEPSNMPLFGLQQQTPAADDPHPHGISDGLYFVSAYVANGTARAGIDMNSTNQPFIFAVGPQGHAPFSDSASAPLRMHSLHGGFSLDMTQAQGISLPLLGTTEVGVARNGASRSDKEYASPSHALIMCFAFIVLFPMGVIALRLFHKVKLHMILQGLGLLFVTVGWILGIVMSKRYNRSKHYTSTHQIIGIAVYILLLVQFAFGFLHHRTFQRTQMPTFMLKPHKFIIGPIVLALGIINNAIGFRFALANSWNMIYIPIVLATVIFLLVGTTLRNLIRGRRRKQNQPFGGPMPPAYAHGNGGDSGGAGGDGHAYDQQQQQQQPLAPYHAGHAQYQQQGGNAGMATTDANWAQRSDIELGKMGPPPSYQPAQPREMI